MKIAKSKLRRIIKEEVAKDKDLLAAIATLADSIESLDISIDFLSATVSGTSALSVGAGQKNLGRLYNPSPSRGHQIEVSEDTSQIEQLVREELNTLLDEIPTWRKIKHQRDETPHPGLSPRPRKGEAEKEEDT